jgi:hypothetical protein
VLHALGKGVGGRRDVLVGDGGEGEDR